MGKNDYIRVWILYSSLKHFMGKNRHYPLHEFIYQFTLDWRLWWDYVTKISYMYFFGIYLSIYFGLAPWEEQ
jgi:hypothetical protein